MFSWFSNFSFDFPLVVLVDFQDRHSSWLDLSTILSTFVGAMLSFSIAWWVHKREIQHQEESDRKAAAQAAMSCYFKISQYANIIANIKEHIDDCFNQAHANGLSADEAYQMVGPHVGKLVEPERLHSHEFAFLLNKTDYELIDDILLLECRALNLNSLLLTYSNLNTEFQKWITSVPGFSRTFDGPIASDIIPKEYVPELSNRAAKLNQVLVGLVDQLEKDYLWSANVVQSFIDASHKSFPDHYPKMTYVVGKNL